MANNIQIKRSLLSAAPSSLMEGEIAYVFGTDTLYIGAPGNTIRIINNVQDLSAYALKTYVDSAISGLVNGAGAAYDTLKELADLLASDQSGISALTTTVAGKLAAASNLSDLTNASTARTNLGLGTMATQNSSAVAITGGSIDGITLNGGTF